MDKHLLKIIIIQLIIINNTNQVWLMISLNPITIHIQQDKNLVPINKIVYMIKLIVLFKINNIKIIIKKIALQKVKKILNTISNNPSKITWKIA